MKQFEDLGRKLTAIRLKRGISQQKMADELGIPFGTYRFYETGNVLPRINHPNFQALFDLLKAESEWLEQESKDL